MISGTGKWRRGEKGRKVGEALGTGLEALRSLGRWAGRTLDGGGARSEGRNCSRVIQCRYSHTEGPWGGREERWGTVPRGTSTGFPCWRRRRTQRARKIGDTPSQVQVCLSSSSTFGLLNSTGPWGLPKPGPRRPLESTQVCASTERTDFLPQKVLYPSGPAHEDTVTGVWTAGSRCPMQVFRIRERGVGDVIGPLEIHTVFFCVAGYILFCAPSPFSTRPSDGAMLLKEEVGAGVCKARPWPCASHRETRTNRRPGR